MTLYCSFVLRGQVSKRFNLSTATCFDDPRLTLVHEDAAEFVKKEVRLPGRMPRVSLDIQLTLETCSSIKPSETYTLSHFVAGPLHECQRSDATACVFWQGNAGYDIIIVDSSDPVGPAETLVEPTFYQVSDR